jgi:hypothetical protein
VKKAEALELWGALAPGQNPLKPMRPIPYKSEGTKYGACGIRIDGSPAFIDAVLSNLKPLLAGENHVTRLELARSPVKDTNPMSGKQYTNRATNAEVCYVRLHMRGHQGVIVSALMDKHLAGATDEFETVNQFARV